MRRLIALSLLLTACEKNQSDLVTCPASISFGCHPDFDPLPFFFRENFGLLIAGDEGERVILLAAPDDGPLALAPLAALAPPFSSDVREDEVLGPGESREVRIRFRPDTPGVFEHSITVPPAALILLEGEAYVPLLRCEPEELQFGIVAQWETKGMRLICINESPRGREVGIEWLENDGAFTTTLESESISVQAGRTFSNIFIISGEVAGPHRATLAVEIEGGASTMISLAACVGTEEDCPDWPAGESP